MVLNIFANTIVNFKYALCSDICKCDYNEMNAMIIAQELGGEVVDRRGVNIDTAEQFKIIAATFSNSQDLDVIVSQLSLEITFYLVLPM